MCVQTSDNKTTTFPHLPSLPPSLSPLGPPRLWSLRVKTNEETKGEVNEDFDESKQVKRRGREREERHKEGVSELSLPASKLKTTPLLM